MNFIWVWPALLAAGCISTPGSKVVAPGNVDVALAQTFEPHHQQGRWVCQGLDLVLVDGVLYELNRDYATDETMDDAEAGEVAADRAQDTFFVWRVASDIAVLFAIPKDPTQPAIVQLLGKVAQNERDAQGKVKVVEFRETVACPAAPPVRVW